MLEQKTLAYLPALEAQLEAHLALSQAPRLQAAMAYSLTAGGKRLRPLLLLSTVATFGGDVDAAMPAAAALEYVHTYSLIHDDLPAMDNDTLRRGQLTNHKRFDEATAILAGDALQSAAFSLLAQTHTDAETLVLCVQAFAEAIGAQGMVAGQMLDMQNTGHPVTLEALKRLHALKTGALIEAAVVIGGALSHVDAASKQALRGFAQAFGVAFQIQDDINDVTKDSQTLGKTANKDVAQGKNTYPALLGLDGAKQAKAQALGEAQAALAQLKRPAPQLAAFLTVLK